MKRTLAHAAVMAAVAFATAPSYAASLTTVLAANAQPATGVKEHFQLESV